MKIRFTNKRPETLYSEETANPYDYWDALTVYAPPKKKTETKSTKPQNTTPETL